MDLILSKDTPQLRRAFREKRDRWLVASDQYVLPDRGITEEEYEQIIGFRQALREAPDELVNATLWVLPVPPPFIRTQYPFTESV